MEITMNQIKSIFILVLLLSPISNINADTFIREYTYNASEADSKLTCRTIALDQVKLLLLQELGTRIQHIIEIERDNKGNSIAKEDISSLSAGFTTVDILEEKWNGEIYYLKAKLQADPKEVLNSIETTSNIHRSFQRKTKENELRLRQARNTILELRKRLESHQSQNGLEAEYSNYINEVNKIELNSIFQKAWILDLNSEYLSAAELYKKAAEKGHIDSQFNLAVLYDVGQGVERNKQKALYWFRKAAEQGDKQAINLLKSRGYN